MRFAACLKKDIRLLTGGGVRSIVFLALPVLLIFIMFFGMRTLASADDMLRPFDIAVRDEDQTIMSRMVTTQLDGISLFDSVIRAEGRTDEELTKLGCAAVVTIPKDFFYDLYDMRDTDVLIALNRDMPQEAAMVKTAFTSLVGILEENQRAHYAAARVKYGELDGERMEEVYYEYSTAALEDALGRLDFFELAGVYKKGFDTSKLFFASSILSMLLMFIPLGVLRSVSEETEAGLIARYRTAGGSFAEALLSKLVVAFAMTAIPCAAVLLILGIGGLSVLIPTLIILFDLSFALFLFVSVICRTASASQLAGNLIMLLILTVGGALYPFSLLPAWIAPLSRAMLPHMLVSSMQYASMGRSFADLAPRLIPYAAAAAALAFVSLLILRARRRA
ncbi:MAG: ABC transporter permease [Clostridiales bacterium]|nr:ABC transporter permease [Clostridiales bacterium]